MRLGLKVRADRVLWSEYTLDASNIDDLAKAVQQIFGDTWMNIIGTRYGEKLFMGKQWGAPHKENRATGCRRYD